MRSEYGLTEGNIIKTIILSFLSFLLVNLAQTLYGAVDLVVAGRYCPSEVVVAVSTGVQVTQIVTSFISGLTLGGMVTVDKYAGMKWMDDAKKTISASLCPFVATGVLLIILLLSLQTPILTLLKISKAAFPQVKQYVPICAMGVFPTCGYNAISAILRGYGDPRSPLLFVAVVGGLNVIGGIFSVKQLHMRVAGTTFATVLSQAFFMVCAMIYLNRRDFIFRFHLSNFRTYGDKVREPALMGIPISLQECMVHLSFLYLVSIINALGAYAASAVGIASKYDVLITLPITSVPGALASTVAQSYGVRRYHRVNRVLFTDVTFVLSFSLAFFLWAQVSPTTMIGVFPMGPAIIETKIPFSETCSFGYLRAPLMFSLSGYLDGRGKTTFTMFSCCSGILTLHMSLIRLACRFLPENLGVIGVAVPAVLGIMVTHTLVYTLKCMGHDRGAMRCFASSMYQ